MMNFEYLYVFMQSNLLEVPLYWLFFRRYLGFTQILLLVTLANACTHPLVFFGFMGSGLSYLVSVLAAEAFAVAGETTLDWQFGRLPLVRSLIAALVANLFSWQVAPMLTYHIIQARQSGLL